MWTAWTQWFLRPRHIHGPKAAAASTRAEDISAVRCRLLQFLLARGCGVEGDQADVGRYIHYGSKYLPLEWFLDLDLLPRRRSVPNSWTTTLLMIPAAVSDSCSSGSLIVGVEFDDLADCEAVCQVVHGLIQSFEGGG